MGARSRAQAQQLQDAQAECIKSLAGDGTVSPADEIAKAKALLDAGASRRRSSMR
ncbi:hypothetical protein [Microbacterium sp. GXF7504]